MREDWEIARNLRQGSGWLEHHAEEIKMDSQIKIMWKEKLQMVKELLGLLWFF